MKHLQTRILFVLPRSIDSPTQEDEDEDEGDESQDGAQGTPGRSEAESQPDSALETVSVPSALTNPYLTAAPQPAHTLARDSGRNKRSVQVDSEVRTTSSVRVVGVGAEDGYDGDLVGKIHQYADRCTEITRRELFDVIHAHDWMTFPAATAIAEFSGRPMVAHIHATEFDRSGENGNSLVYDIERYGMHSAARVITVSERTKQIVVQRYGVPAWKVVVIHNGIEPPPAEPRSRPPHRDKVVLFLGRITRQKGPEYFIRAAARVAEWMRDVRFVVAGTGDQLPHVIRLADELGLTDLVEFKGFLHGADVDRAYEAADVYAMPSVSEPFGLTALEAIRHGVPVVLSKESGAAEVLPRGTLKVDSWDVEMMAKMIVSVLRYPALAETMRRVSETEIRGLTWEEAARKCIRLYHDVTTLDGTERKREI